MLLPPRCAAALAATLLMTFPANVSAYGRRRLKPQENIADHIKNELAQGINNPKFTISTENKGTGNINDGSGNGNSNGNGNGNSNRLFDFDVILPEQAVTQDTIYIGLDGKPQPVGDLGNVILVSDVAGGGSDTVTLLSVNLRTSEVQGVVDKKGQKTKKLKQMKGQASVVDDDDDFLPPAWSCGTKRRSEVNPSISDGFKKGVSGQFFGGRGLAKDYFHNHDQHEHLHKGHDHSHELEDGLESAIHSVRESLRGSHVRRGERRKLQSGGSYSYQVDLYIDIDTSLVNKKGGENGAKNYVNLIITGANVMYESEIDTHLHVSTIEFTTSYDSLSNTDAALDKIKQRHNNNWAPGVDLYHGILGKGLGGGIAYIGAICDSDWGYGISADINGQFSDINSAVVWDLTVVAHELGHNFNSGHTHEDYSPVVDNCGNSCNPNPVANSATMMSYCDLCSGGLNVLLYTFGGKWSGSGNQADLNEWVNNPELSSSSSFQSVNPRRVPHTMWSHVSTRGNCVAVSNTPQPTPQPTPQSTAQPTPQPTSKPTVNAVPTQSPTTPKPTEAPVLAVYDSSLGAPKCSVAQTVCDSSTLLNGRANISGGPEPNQPNSLDTCTDGTDGDYHSDESIDRIVVRSSDGNFAGNTAVTIEATVWGYDDGSSDYAHFFYASDASNPSWTLLGTLQPPSGGLHTLTFNHQLSSGFPLQAVRVTFEYNSSGPNTASCPGGSWTDVDDLVFAVNTNSSPTKPPTKSPTKSPTRKPSFSPTKKPTISPTKKPTISPTNKPTDSSTPQPTNKPSVKPSVKPTNNPTSSPNSQPLPPTKLPTTSPTTPPTNQPTSSDLPNYHQPVGGGAGPQVAEFDNSLGAPSCSVVGSSCDTGASLVLGRANKGPEPNHPNSLDGCSDGADGSFHSDESVDRIIVKTEDGSPLTAGKTAIIEATVYAYSVNYDRADFYYTSDASNPVWTYIATKVPTVSDGTSNISVAYELPGGALQAVRVNFRYGGNAGSCTGGDYDDVDDLVFAVNDVPLPGWKAKYNSDLGAPLCDTLGLSRCDSATLLVGRAGLGPEPNEPNTIDGCADGTDGKFHEDESLDRLIVETTDGTAFSPGSSINVKATVYAWGGESDRAHFYYAADANNPVWEKFATITPDKEGSQTITAQHTLQAGSLQAVRVNFLYFSGSEGDGACEASSWADRDDLVFAVSG